MLIWGKAVLLTMIPAQTVLNIVSEITAISKLIKELQWIYQKYLRRLFVSTSMLLREQLFFKRKRLFISLLQG